jgi:hypothetical protein
MSRFEKSIYRLLPTLLAVALALALVPRAAAAEKPANFTKGIPYQHQIILGSDDPRCSAFGCDVSFPPVPDGKRLVVQHVSLDQVLLAGFTSIATLRTGSFGETDIRINLIPHEDTLGGGNLLVRYSQPVFGFVDAGVAPLIQTGAAGAGIVTSSGTTYFLSGFLVPMK